MLYVIWIILSNSSIKETPEFVTTTVLNQLPRVSSCNTIELHSWSYSTVCKHI